MERTPNGQEQAVKINGSFPKSIVALAVRIVAAGANFFLYVSVSRTLSLENAGLFFLFFGYASFFSSIARFGFDTYLLRHASRIQAETGELELGANYAFCIGTSFLGGSVMALGLYVYLWLIGYSDQADAFGFLTAAVPVLAVQFLHANLLLSQKKVILSIAASNFLTPALFIVLTWATRTDSLSEISQMFLIASIVSSLACAALWGWGARATLRRGTLHVRDVLHASIPMWHSGVLTQLLQWLPVFLLGWFTTSADVAIFSVAQRTILLVSLVLASINTVFSPSFASSSGAGNSGKSLATFRESILISASLGLPILILIAVFPHWILQFFNNMSANGALIVRVLLIGQFFNVLTGSSGVFLLMSGMERRHRFNLMLSLLVLLVLGVLLGQFHGLLGVAISVASVVALSNLLNFRSALSFFRNRDHPSVFGDGKPK